MTDLEALAAGGRELLDGDPGHARRGWAMLAPLDELADRGGVALGLELDRTVDAVLDPADDAQPACLCRGRSAVRHALNTPADDRVDPTNHEQT